MPLNELEKHPYLDYFKEYHSNEDVPWHKYTRLFIGSFPVYNITRTVYPLDKVVDRSQILKNDCWNFFYGSKTNDFWKYLLMSFGEMGHLENYNSLTEQDLIEFLEKKNILLTDVVVQTNRFKRENNISKPESPADDALLNKSGSDEVKSQFILNSNIIQWLVKAENVDAIYFTAQGVKGKTPGGWFYQILEDTGVSLTLHNEKNNCKKYLFGAPINRAITLFFLPTPSALRSINMGPKNAPHPMFANFVLSRDATFFGRLKNKSFSLTKTEKDKLQPFRKAFVREWWTEHVLKKNMLYNGSTESICNSALEVEIL